MVCIVSNPEFFSSGPFVRPDQHYSVLAAVKDVPCDVT